MTSRDARRKLGSRSIRRAGLNGKTLGGAPTGKNAQVQLRRHPLPHAPGKPSVAARVRVLVQHG
jgi:hypothetical protein